MSKPRLVITAVVVEGRSQSEVARTYGVSQSWISRLVARYRVEGETAFEPRSRRPTTSPQATEQQLVDLIVQLRAKLTHAGLDAGADTIGWHLRHTHRQTVSRATINRILTRAGLVTAEPAKRPKSSYIRFQAAQPNQTWQSGVTHYRLTEGTNVDVLTWLDDHSRFALNFSAHRHVTGSVVVATFRNAAAQHGYPASTLTDNAMVYTTRLSGGSIHGTGGRNAFEHELRQHNIVQKNSRPNHPTTCGKVERFQQTLKNWLRAQPTQPATLADLQALLELFVDEYNHRRPHRSLPHQATPATAYQARPKAAPGQARANDTHNRVRVDRVDSAGSVTLRINGRLHHIGVGRTHARTPVLLLVQDLHIRVVHAATGEPLRDFILDPNRNYQGTGRPPGPPPAQQRKPEPQ